MYYSPVCYKIQIIGILFNLHVLGLLLAFILSQDQTLINFSFINFTIYIIFIIIYIFCRHEPKKKFHFFLGFSMQKTNLPKNRVNSLAKSQRIIKYQKLALFFSLKNSEK